MIKIFEILYGKWIAFKIWLRVDFMYPYKKNYAQIKSIVPAHVALQQGIVIEENVHLSGQLKKIGKYVYIGKDTHIGHCSLIGSFTSISYGVKIGMVNHPLENVSTSPVFYAKRRGWVSKNKFQEGWKGIVEIGNDVLISANAVILEGVKIGNGAVIAAGAVVNKDVEPYSIVGGIPAKHIRFRFDAQTISNLNNSRWWEMEDEKLKSLANYFNNPSEFLNKLHLFH